MKTSVLIAFYILLVLTIFQNCGDPLPMAYRSQNSLALDDIELVSQIPIPGDYAVAKGQEVVLSAQFTGGESIQYSWYEGDSLISPDDTRYTIRGNQLTVRGLPVSGTGVYRVEANGRVSSRNVVLREMGEAVEPIYFEGQLATDLTLDSSTPGNVTLTGSVMSNVDTQYLQYKWYRNGGVVEGQNSATLNLPKMIGYAGGYQLSVTNLLTNQVIFSNIANVSINHTTTLTDFCTDHYIRLRVYNNRIENSQNTQLKIEVSGLGTRLDIGRNCPSRFRAPSSILNELIPANSQHNRLTVTAVSPSARGCNNNMNATHGPVPIGSSRQSTKNLTGTCSASGGQYPDLNITILAQPPK